LDVLDKASDPEYGPKCDPQISGFRVRAATILNDGFWEEAVIGGNTEYGDPRAIHGETSLVNHALNAYGHEKVRELLRVIALYSSFGPVTPCGDCRDYLLASTDPQKLVIVTAGEKDPNVQIHPFTDFLAPEEGFDVAISPREAVARINDEDFYTTWFRALSTRHMGGVNLFSPATTRAVVLARERPPSQPKYYEAASCDDGAFHLRFPVGGALQAAATDGAYFVDFIAVARSDGEMPRITYRDRQYANEADGFNKIAGRQPLKLILDGRDVVRMTTLDKALPHSFSTFDFAPEKVEAFLKSKGAL